MKYLLTLLLFAGSLHAQLGQNQLWWLAAQNQVEVDGGAYTVQLATFDGTDWLERDANLDNEADSAKFTFSWWGEIKGTDGTTAVFFNNNNGRANVFRHTTGQLQCRVYDGSGTEKYRALSNLSAFPAITNGTGPIHILISVNNASSGGYQSIFINDIDCSSTPITFAQDDAAFDFTPTLDWSVGANITGASPLTADMGDFFLQFGESADMTTTSNRRKFIDASGNPVGLGSDGSTPFGSAADIFLTDPYNTFTVNSGDGGNFVLKGGGALTDGGTHP